MILYLIATIGSGCATKANIDINGASDNEASDETINTNAVSLAPSDSDELIGTWQGTWYGGPTRQWDVTIRFDFSDSQQLTGRILFYGGIAYTNCTGAGITVNKVALDLYSIDIKNDPDCNAKGELQLTGDKLTGKTQSESGWTKTLFLSRSTQE